MDTQALAAIISNNYGMGRDDLGYQHRCRLHTDDSIEVKYYDEPTKVYRQGGVQLPQTQVASSVTVWPATVTPDLPPARNNIWHRTETELYRLHAGSYRETGRLG